MQHHIEIDQSGKVEQTDQNTVLAFSDGVSRSLLIPAIVKRACQQELRIRGVKPGMIALRMFVAGLILLLENRVDDFASITIDTEYSGREGQIKGLLLEFIHRWDPDLPREAIVFRQVGKKSRSHKLAWETQKGKRKPDRTVTSEELLQYC